MSVTSTSETKIAACGTATRSHWAPTVCIQPPMLLATSANQIARNGPLRSGAHVDPDGADFFGSVGIRGSYKRR